MDVPCIAIVGGYSLDAPLCAGLCAIFSIQNEPKCFEEAVIDSEEKIYSAAENIVRVWRASRAAK
jgi:glycerate kinase